MNISNISNYKLGTAAYQRDEQTINKDAKTAGGIKGFSSNHMNVTKWWLNRPNLDEFTRLVKYSGEYKPLRESEVQKSEANILKVIDVLENEYINPFNVSTKFYIV